jgi:hypothetical protein
MIDLKTIILPATMPLHQRISEAARQIQETLRSRENKFDQRGKQVRLVSCVKENGMFRYTYEFLSKASESPPDENGTGGVEDS